MTESLITWHRGEEPGDREARINSRTAAVAHLHESTPRGYWGRYRGAYFPAAGGQEKLTASSLKEFKAMVARRAANETRDLDLTRTRISQEGGR